MKQKKINVHNIKLWIHNLCLSIHKYIDKLNRVEKKTLFYKGQEIIYTILAIVPFIIFAVSGTYIKIGFIFQFLTLVISVYLIYKLISYKNPNKKHSKKTFIIIQLSLTIIFCLIFLLKYLLSIGVLPNKGLLTILQTKQIVDLLIIYIDLWTLYFSMLGFSFMIYNIFPNTMKSKVKLSNTETILILLGIISILIFGELNISNIAIVTIIYAFIVTQITPKTFYILSFPETSKLPKEYSKKSLTIVQFSKIILGNLYISTILATYLAERYLDIWSKEKWFKIAQIPYQKGDLFFIGSVKLILFALFFLIITILFKFFLSYIRRNREKIFY